MKNDSVVRNIKAALFDSSVSFKSSKLPRFLLPARD